MSDSVSRFSNRVENYVKYRPHYPADVLRVFQENMSLRVDSVVADIGAGTGISAKIFLENGNHVFAVEPNAAMRHAMEEYLREFPNLKIVDGTAENTNLLDDSVDFVVAAQAFHWFDPERTRTEVKRILRDDGYAVLIWNERELDTNDFLREYEKFLVKYGTDYEKYRHDNLDENMLREFFQTDFSTAAFPNVQTLDFEGLKGRMLSASYMPTEQSDAFEPMIDELRRLFEKYAESGKIKVLYQTNFFYARI